MLREYAENVVDKVFSVNKPEIEGHALGSPDMPIESLVNFLIATNPDRVAKAKVSPKHYDKLLKYIYGFGKGHLNLGELDTVLKEKLKPAFR